MRILSFAASLRKDSLNRKLALVANEILAEMGHEVDFCEYNQFNVELFNQEREANANEMPGLMLFKEKLIAADAVFLATPEYNYSIPGHLKNLIDWASRLPEKPLAQAKWFLAATSPGMVGGGRGVWQVRIPLEGCGGHVYNEMFLLPKGHEGFDAAGKFQNSKSHEILKANLLRFCDWAQKLSD